MFAREINVKVSDVPPGWGGAEVADFINKLLKRRSKERLGRGGIHEVKDHSWLRGIQWNDIYKKEVMTPFKPKDADNFDSSYCNKIDQIDKQTYDYYLHKINIENYFQNFYFNYYDENKPENAFELDGIIYRFSNPHDESNKNKETNQKQLESIGNKISKSTSISGITTNTPRLTENPIINQTHSNFNANLSNSQISSRKLINGNI